MSETTHKKDLTQDQIEDILEEQFSILGASELFAALLFVVFLVGVWPLLGMSFATLPMWFKVVWWIATGIAFHQIRMSLRKRRIRKTIEAMRDK